MMARKTAEKAFCRNAQDFSREEFTIPVFNCDGKGFFWKCDTPIKSPLSGLSQSVDAIMSSTLLIFF